MNGTIGDFLQYWTVIRAVGLQGVLDCGSRKSRHILRAQDEFCKMARSRFPTGTRSSCVAQVLNYLMLKGNALLVRCSSHWFLDHYLDSLVNISNKVQLQTSFQKLHLDAVSLYL
jgi:hypothetical protein